MKGFSFFLEGIKDAASDLLTDELGGTQEDRVLGCMNEASGWPEEDPHTDGYRMTMALVLARIDYDEE